MKKITLEEHFISPAYAQHLHDLQSQGKADLPPEFEAMLTDPAMQRGIKAVEAMLADLDDGRLAAMDACGIDMQVLSLSAPTFSAIQGERETNQAISMAQQANDYLAEQVRKHPDRYAGFAALPLQDPKAAADELERAVTQLGFKGALVNGHTNGEYLDERKFWGVWERAEQLDVPIYLHPADPPSDQMKIYEGYPSLRGAVWNWTVETATHALRIICSGIFDAFPKVTLLLGHMGEALPYTLQRIDRWQYTPQSKQIQHPPSYYIKNNVMITTSGNCSTEALICALLAVGADHILFSADYPYAPLDSMTRFVATAPISEIDREKICHLNAERLLKLL
ncbi:MAG TPA: amidohydrolase family protein [Ktedonosporobacter sp.]|nr:amidohydrolase family protein [Ktedonosporobacter sp.]